MYNTSRGFDNYMNEVSHKHKANSIIQTTPYLTCSVGYNMEVLLEHTQTKGGERKGNTNQAALSVTHQSIHIRSFMVTRTQQLMCEQFNYVMLISPLRIYTQVIIVPSDH